MTTASATAYPDDAEIVARGATYYRVTRYVMTVALIGMGLWFAYDGWVKYPQQNQEQSLERGKEIHSKMDILLQKALGVTLPPLGIALLIWTLYNSRGSYRLRGDTISVPGHQDVPIDSIRMIDKSKWDRKGIARLEYDHAGRTGRMTLDDFIYEMVPTRAILERIEAKLLPEGEAPPAAEAAEASEPIPGSDAEG